MNEEEIPELKSLHREVPPPADLEERVVAAIQARQLIRRRAIRKARWWQAAAAIVILTVGFGLGRWQPPARQQEPTFVLLLHEEGNWQKPTTPADEQDRVNEYRAWAIQLRAKGQLVQGTKLRDDRHDLDRNVPTGTGITGFFEITARTLDEALAIARTCPHLRYGGQVEVREVERT
ncbi:MAG TPA: hypothetical protein VGV35_00765 [Bryobacteraceae bacterium]|nr:hypothetical protein [Bryobacteraceae bacterium]